MKMTSLEFKTVRVTNRLTQKEFAQKLGIAERAVQNYEAGTRDVPLLVELEIKKVFNIKGTHETVPILKNGEQKGIPVIPGVHTTGSVTTLFRDEHDEKPLFYLDAPEVKGCDYGVRVIGDSMFPLIRNGGYVACKNITNREHILYGEIFHVVTADYSTVKYIKPHPKKSDWVLLVPYNDSIAPTPIPKKDILKLAQVRAILQVI